MATRSAVPAHLRDRHRSWDPQHQVKPAMMMFAGIVGSIFVTLYVVKLILQGNGDSPSNYL